MFCIDCKHNDIVRDNHDNAHVICTCAESPNFLGKVSYVFSGCDYGEADKKESEEE